MESPAVDDNFKGLSDEKLTELLQTGNEQAFNELTFRYEDLIKLKTSAVFILGFETDDLVQEARLALFDAALSYNKDKKASFRTYANVCITRRIISAYKSSSRQKNIPLNEFLPIDDSCEIEMNSPNNDSPEAILISREDYEKLEKRIRDELSEFEFTVLFRLVQGESYEQIAKELSVSEKSVDNAIQRTRKKLRN